MAMTVPGMVLSQPPRPRMASIWWPRTTSSMASAITSRLTREHFMPSWPMASPSVTTKVLNFSGTPPASRMPVLAIAARSSRCTLHGRDLAARAGHADDGLVEVLVGEADGAEHRPVGHPRDASGHDPAAAVQLVSRRFSWLSPSSCETVHVRDPPRRGADVALAAQSRTAVRVPLPGDEALAVRFGHGEGERRCRPP